MFLLYVLVRLIERGLCSTTTSCSRLLLLLVDGGGTVGSKRRRRRAAGRLRRSRRGGAATAANAVVNDGDLAALDAKSAVAGASSSELPCDDCSIYEEREAADAADGTGGGDLLQGETDDESPVPAPPLRKFTFFYANKELNAAEDALELALAEARAAAAAERRAKNRKQALEQAAGQLIERTPRRRAHTHV